jgi:hypothetical protein
MIEAIADSGFAPGVHCKLDPFGPNYSVGDPEPSNDDVATVQCRHTATGTPQDASFPSTPPNTRNGALMSTARSPASVG